MGCAGGVRQSTDTRICSTRSTSDSRRARRAMLSLLYQDIRKSKRSNALVALSTYPGEPGEHKRPDYSI